MDRHCKRDLLFLAVIPLLAFGAFAHFHGSEPLITPDSPGYMYFGEDRPVGYPLFLALVKMLTGGFNAARYVQLGALCAALMALTFSFRAWAGALLPALAFEIVLFANPGLLMLSNQLMADCLSAACVAMFAAVILGLLQKPRLCLIWALVFWAAAGMTIRPVNIALVPAAFFAIIIFGRDLKPARWVQIAVLVIGVIAAQAITPVTHMLRHDPMMASNPLARGLLQKTLFHQWPAHGEAEACDGPLIAKDMAPVNAYLDKVPADIRPYLLHPYSGYMRFMVIIPEMLEAHKTDHFANIDPIIMCYATARIKSDPAFFVQDTAHQFWGLLTYSTFVSHATHDKIDDFLKTNPPVVPAAIARHDVDYQLRGRAVDDLKLEPSVFASSDIHISAPKARPRILALGLSTFQIIGALYMLGGIVFMLMSSVKHPAKACEFGMCAVGILGTVFFGEMVLTSIVEIALPRYVFPLWPLLCATFGIAIMGSLAIMRPNLRAGNSTP